MISFWKYVLVVALAVAACFWAYGMMVGPPDDADPAGDLAEGQGAAIKP
jgi:hypothetical protein